MEGVGSESNRTEPQEEPQRTARTETESKPIRKTETKRSFTPEKTQASNGISAQNSRFRCNNQKKHGMWRISKESLTFLPMRS